jgi:hypothetical protein
VRLLFHAAGAHFPGERVEAAETAFGDRLNSWWQDERSAPALSAKQSLRGERAQRVTHSVPAKPQPSSQVQLTR